ncbi:MAG: hypothetical protein IBX68_10530, partial [Dehalococcoidia bacterium]|nr:hypothetical protein [Dehalococcoidia bacterium]
IQWKRDEFWNYDVPVDIPGVNLDRFDLKNFYREDGVEQIAQRLKRERVEWLSRFAGLDQDVVTPLC